ncbi:MAG: hypothetical protein ABW321_08205 [Polyangiales bacterium]
MDDGGYVRALQRVCRVSAAAAALFPAPAARADYLWADGETRSLGAGVFIGYQFGARQAFEWGVEAFMTQRFRPVAECESTERFGMGPLVQLGLRGLRDPRVTLALQGGGELSRSGFALTGELGVSYRFGSAPGFGLHLGIVPELAIFNVAARYEAFRHEAWVGGGARFFPTYGQPGLCAIGRPLRAAQSVYTLTLADDPAPGTSAAQLAAWELARDAQLECASVTAFVQLAMELMQLGAPASLVHATLDAAQDELRHAQLCAALAERDLRDTVCPVLPPIAPRHVAQADEALLQLAVESWRDGCLAEGTAARQAAAGAEQTHDAATASVLQAIARDEAAHAELAWSVLAFCVARGGAHVQHALTTAIDHDAPAVIDERASGSGLARYGRVSTRTVTTLAREQRRASLPRLRAQIARAV